MTVGEKIFTLRTQAGYSQEEFAEIIGVSRQSVSKWETSSSIPDTEYVIKICKLLSVSCDALLLDGDLPTASRNNVQQLSEADSAQHTQRDSEAVSREDNRILTVVGFVLSFFISIVGLILSCIALKRGEKTATASQFAVAGIVISSVSIYIAIIFFAVYGTLGIVYGGML